MNCVKHTNIESLLCIIYLNVLDVLSSNSITSVCVFFPIGIKYSHLSAQVPKLLEEISLFLWCQFLKRSVKEITFTSLLSYVWSSRGLKHLIFNFNSINFWCPYKLIKFITNTYIIIFYVGISSFLYHYNHYYIHHIRHHFLST